MLQEDKPGDRLIAVFLGFEPGDNVHVHTLGFFREDICVDLQLGDQVDQGIDTTLCLQEFIENDYFSEFKDTVAALKSTSFIA